MGGRGTSSGRATSVYSSGTTTISAGPTAQSVQPQQATQPQQPLQQAPAAPTAPMPTTQQQLKQMNDSEVLKVLRTADRVDLPNHLNDRNDPTQKLIYTIGLNAPPTIMDAKDFSKFMRDNNISRSEIMSREVGSGKYRTTSGTMRNLTPQQIAQMWVSDPYNYIGGKHGGQALGAGAYFAMNGGRGTGYASNGVKLNAVLNPKTARIVDAGTLRREAQRWAASHPQADRKLRAMAGRSGASFGRKDLSLYATILGYNVISGGGSYYNVIDRSAVVVRQ